MNTERKTFAKRILSIILCVVMVLAMLPITLMTTQAATSGYDGTPVTPTKITSSNYLSFGLTESNWSSYNGYYGIRSAAELYGFANLVNSGSNTISGVLLQDIVINKTVSASGATYSWTPIGNSSNPYLGTFDGNGCTISGIYINGSGTNVGLFGVAGYCTNRPAAGTAVIKNVILSNSYIKGSQNVAGIVGKLEGSYVTVSKCKVDSTVSIFATHDSEPYVAGITGGFGQSMFGTTSVCTVADCLSFATIKAVNADDYVGAVIGFWRMKDNAQKFVVASNCYYLDGCTTDKNGEVQGGTGGYSDQYNWCTALASANASHTCVSVEHKEVKATCQYPGRSAYSECLICGTVTSGTKTDYACIDHLFSGTATCKTPTKCIYCGIGGVLDPDNHEGSDVTYASKDKNEHYIYCNACNNVKDTQDHTFRKSICSLCNYQCTHPDMQDGVCLICDLGSVHYIDREWSNDEHAVISIDKHKKTIEYTTITSDLTEWSDGWYVLFDNVTISSRVTVSGSNVHLILMDGCTLTINGGINLESGKGLYIYGQSEGSGALIATASEIEEAGIGGNYCKKMGTFIVDGGWITATGGERAAGIGGGDFGAGGTYIQNGGFVTASSARSGAGIGGGVNSNGGSVTINGGTLVASTKGSNSSGIGGSNGGSGGALGTVVIRGGNIKSTIVNKSSRAGSLTDGNGNTVVLHELTLNNLNEVREISAVEISDGRNYGITDVQTVDTNILYFWLPADASVTSVTAGDTKYICNRNGTLYTEHGEWVDATCSIAKYCTECNVTEGNTTAHNFVNGVCSVCGMDINGHFYISTAEQLVNFANYVNIVNRAANATVVADVDMTNADLGFSMIGTSDNPYAGTFDGGNHTITVNLTGERYVALFRFVNGATIENLIVDGTITASDMNAAGIISWISGGDVELKNCISSVDIVSSKDGDGTHGGLVGVATNTLILKNCAFTGAINGSNTTSCGGFIGWVNAGVSVEIENCYQAASFGISATNGHTIARNYASANMSVTNFYYLNALNEIPTSDEITKVTAEQLASGEVTYKLNGGVTDGTQVWYQTLTGDNAQAYPQFSGSVVYYNTTDGYFNHVHVWKYTEDSENKNIIHAECTAEGCTASDGGTLTISIPENLTYSNSEKEVAITNNLLTGIEIPKVTYSGDALTDGKPINAGKYTATITIGEATATVKFTITAAKPSIGTVTANTLTDTLDVSKVELSRSDDSIKGKLELTAAALRYGIHSYSWKFTPESDNYTELTGTVDITVVDSTKPTAEIEVGTNWWNTFLNKITFGLFFKETQTITITAADENGSGVKKVYYYLSNEAVSEDELANVDWIEYTGSIDVKPNNKYFIYAKVVDEQDNTTIVSSDGIVLYTDSTAVDTEISFTKLSRAEVVAKVNLNDNTIKTVKNGNAELTEGTDYTWDGEGTVSFAADYLDTLAAGNYTLTIYYNPLGEKTDAVEITTNLALTVVKNEGKVTQFDPPNMEYEHKAVEPSIQTNNTDNPDVKYEYKVQGADDDTYTTTAPMDAGKYTVRATVPATENFTKIVETRDFEITAYVLKNIVVDVKDKEYDGTTTAKILSVSYEYIWKDGNGVSDDVAVDMDASTGNFVDKNVGTDKSATFTLVLTGADKDNYVIDTDSVTINTAEITAKEIGLNWGTTTFTYDGKIHAPSATATGLIGDDECTITVTGAQIDANTAAVSTYTATASALSNANYKLPANNTITFTISNATQDAPVVNKTDETISKKADGTITEVDSAMEYRKASDSVYTVVSAEEATAGMISKLEAGTYYVRYAAKTNYDASADTEVVIASGRKLTVSVPNEEDQIGYTLTTTTPEVDWYGSIHVEFKLEEGYSMPSDFEIYNNGTEQMWRYFNQTTGVLELNFVANDFNFTVEGIADIIVPSAEITLDANAWNTFLNNITFGLFFKEIQTVTVTASDNGSGLKEEGIFYYLADKELTEDEVKAITDWTLYEGEFSINPDNEYVIYVMAVDNDENVVYINSEGIVLDSIVPVISGVEDGATYYTTQKLIVTDDNLATITVNGEDRTEELLQTDNVVLAGNVDATYIIVVTDKAGNQTTVEVAMKKIADLESPKTGDISNNWMWAALLFVSGGCVAIVVVEEKKRKVK